MSYIIQNTQSPHSTLRANPKLRSSFMVRNASIIFFLLFNSSRLFNIHASSINFRRQLTYYSDVSFLRFGSLLMRGIGDVKYEPIGTNYALSAYYTALRRLDQYSSSSKPTLSLLRCTTRVFLNPYFRPVSFILTSASKSSFQAALHKFLRMLLHSWFAWPKKNISISTHSFISANLSLLRFLNLYYFKVYRV